MEIKKLLFKFLSINFNNICISSFLHFKGGLLFLIFFACSAFLQAQHEKNFWYFGDHAGLNFNSGTPVALTNGAMFCGDNTASFSDANSGNLLFYSNGNSVWNRNHTVMPNGSGLLGNITGGDCAFPVKQPGSDSLFYLFTCDAFGWSNGLRYSIIDMSLNGGLGDVTSTKNVQLLNPSTEKITAIKRVNNVDIWIITHPWNSNAFYVYLLTSSGLSTSPIVTTIGSTHAGGTNGYYNAMGQMSASPDGDKLVCAIYDLNVYELFDFNRNTGALSNFISISGYPHAWGTEFSSDGTKLYTTKWQFPSIYQFDLSSNNQSTINSSATVVGTATTPDVLYKCGYLQRGPDDKIYVAKYSSTYLGVIDSPNSPGLSCNYIDNGIYLGGKICQGGLPSFMQTTRTPTNINEKKSNYSNISIYPNPLSASATIKLNMKSDKIFFRIFDLNGKQLREDYIINSDTYTFYKNNLPCGLYFYQIVSDNVFIGNGKFIIAE